MTLSKPLLTVLRAGALVLALGVGGYLVVGAQQRATGGGAAPERTLAQPTFAPDAAGQIGSTELADPFLFSSKSAAIEVLPPGVTVIEAPADVLDDATYLPSSKDPGPDVLRSIFGDEGEVSGKAASGQEGAYLPSSKILSPDVLKAVNEGGAPPPPINPAFLRSSKSLTIDGALLTPRPAAPDPKTVSSDGLVIPNDDVRAAWEKLTDEEKRAIYLTTSKSLSPDALPGVMDSVKGSAKEANDGEGESAGGANAEGVTSKKGAKGPQPPKKD